MAIIQGIGYPDSNRSHFRGMDIWHTCEPDRVGSEGWLGLAIRELDPKSENVLTGVNIGQGLPRAMSVAGVPVTSISDLEGYGVMNQNLDIKIGSLHIECRCSEDTVSESTYGCSWGEGGILRIPNFSRFKYY